MPKPIRKPVKPPRTLRNPSVPDPDDDRTVAPLPGRLILPAPEVSVPLTPALVAFGMTLSAALGVILWYLERILSLLEHLPRMLPY